MKKEPEEKQVNVYLIFGVQKGFQGKGINHTGKHAFHLHNNLKFKYNKKFQAKLKGNLQTRKKACFQAELVKNLSIIKTTLY